ncbi:MAG TPA: response regulator [Bacteroidia bacterium]|nr:response regulator [Bacteroidia bacterium]
MKHKYKCMLMIDDDDDSTYLVKCYQERNKLAAHFYTFKTGKEAMDFIHSVNTGDKTVLNHFPDLILVDINMPEMDGFDFLTEFKRIPIPENEKPKIFILSGSNHPKDISRAGKFDIDGYFVKPFTNKQLNYLAS